MNAKVNGKDFMIEV